MQKETMAITIAIIVFFQCAGSTCARPPGLNHLSHFILLLRKRKTIYVVTKCDELALSATLSCNVANQFYTHRNIF